MCNRKNNKFFDLMSDKLSCKYNKRTEILAHFESCETHIRKMWDIAEQNRIIYTSLNEKAFEHVSVIVEKLIKDGKVKLAIELVKQCPDNIERTLCMHHLLNIKGENHGKN